MNIVTMEPRLGKAARRYHRRYNRDSVVNSSVVLFAVVKETDEKRMLRHYELLKQDDMFIEKSWDEQFVKEKKFKSAAFDGNVSGVSITTKWKRALSKPTTRIIPGLNVYRGNIKEHDFANQHYIFTVEILDYAAAEAKYRDWERWPYVGDAQAVFS